MHAPASTRGCTNKPVPEQSAKLRGNLKTKSLPCGKAVVVGLQAGALGTAPQRGVACGAAGGAVRSWAGLVSERRRGEEGSGRARAPARHSLLTGQRKTREKHAVAGK